MQNKIDMIFKVGIKHDHKQLVLGALGCGVFNNPTEEVAKMFKNPWTIIPIILPELASLFYPVQKNLNFEIFKKILIG